MAGRRRVICAAVLVLVWVGQDAHAGAWPTQKGRTQAILKIEVMEATQGFDALGDRTLLLADQTDHAISLFVEHGLTDRLTLQLKTDWQDGEDAFHDYSGRGPAEVGMRAVVWRGDWSVVSLYAGHAFGGDARNAVYAAPGEGEGDWDLRILAGRSFRSLPVFIEAQAARRLRRGLSDETRLDVTAGARLAPEWMVLGQVFSGAADEGPRWADVEASVVRDMGVWSLQAGWRHRVEGRDAPRSAGPILGVWRRF